MTEVRYMDHGEGWREREQYFGWLKELIGTWCSNPVLVNGHLIPCDKGEGHVGICDVETGTLKRHIHKGVQWCIESRCPAEVGYGE